MDQTEAKDISTKPMKPRNSFIAFFLSLLFPGLGQVYNGQLKKGLLFFGLLLLFPVIFGITRGATFFYGVCSLLVIEVGLRIYIIIDGVIHARRQKDYVLKPYNRWYYHLLLAIGMWAILLMYDTITVIGIQTFSMPVISNNPTLQVGDRLVSDMKAYAEQNPDYGDLVAYSRPDGQIYIFRVVGLPNDTVGLVDNIVSINGQASKATFIKETTNNEISVLEYEEELPNGRKHLLYTSKQITDRRKPNMTEVLVPANSYFVLGDNRDQAADSRFEGFISRERIKGKIVFSYWGKTLDRMNIRFDNK